MIDWLNRPQVRLAVAAVAIAMELRNMIELVGDLFVSRMEQAVREASIPAASAEADTLG